MSADAPMVMHAKLAPERDSAISDEERVSAAGRTSNTDLPPTDARRSWRSSSSVLPENMQPVMTWIEPARFIPSIATPLPRPPTPGRRWFEDIRHVVVRLGGRDAKHPLTSASHARSVRPLSDLLLLSLGGRGSFRLILPRC